MKEFEKKIYSQQGEDGIVDYIFEKIGTTNRVAVEFGVSANSQSGLAGAESNTLNLAMQGWKTFWLDSEPIVQIPTNCIFRQVLLTPDNICSVFKELEVPNEFDLLSIDVDGNDYHLRQSLKDYRPRVVIMEYNGSYDGDTEYIMPRNDSYRWRGDRLFGASLLSMTKQANNLGYDLVYCDQNGVNAFYVQKDINCFPAQTSQQAYVQLFWTR